ncbi:hypothetical protein BGZ95_010717 [Linnemannia exigua]|uniref:NACHT domain-containing protein n=1 Tax=Linnemannia exigua TaxID=604196 RepID=A0AAD4H4T5_9FUNG|nr:hypothetical protein BGZ95_010717 [Linnemannia exigua]
MKSKLRRAKKSISRFLKCEPKAQALEATSTTTKATTTTGRVKTPIPMLNLGSVADAPVHRIDVAIPELRIADVPLDTHHFSRSNTPTNGTITTSTVSVKVTQTPLEGSYTAGSRLIEIFLENIGAPTPKVCLPKGRFRFESTSQLAFCIGLLQSAQPPPTFSSDRDGTTISSQDMACDTLNRQWIKATTASLFEQDFVFSLARKLVAEFVKEPTKNSAFINEIAVIAPSASPGFLDSGDLVKILAKLSTSLQGIHQQSSLHPYHLTLAVSRVLDVMADHKVQELNRVALHEPLSAVLMVLKGSKDPYLMYQACYALQALQRVPDDETVLQSFLRHSTGMVDGLIKVSGLIQLDFRGFMEGLKEVQGAVEKTVDSIKLAFEGIMSFFESGRGAVDSVKEGLWSGNKRPWYLAVRGATRLVREGRFADLRILITNAPCRQDPLFQMGICQLLGEIADDAAWDVVIRKQALDFIEKLYLNDQDWGQDENVKQWMWMIVCRISKVKDQAVSDHASILEGKLREEDCSNFSDESPLRPRLCLSDTCSLLNEVQHIPEIEVDLHSRAIVQQEYHLREQLSVYIPPQAKTSRRAEDSDHSPLMREVITFLAGERHVLLLLGDSGAGKTTFNHKLAYDLWRSYTIGGPIPLFVNLPTIEQPDKDLIAELLSSSSYRFSASQIKELEKQERQFILICDGYDERQLNTNLHTTNRLNQPGCWKAKLIVSCRSQYLKKEYLHNFQPKSVRSTRFAAATELFQEAVIVPFTSEQVEEYVQEFVGLSNAQLGLRDRPNWTAKEYMAKLKAIPDLMELVGNPFLLTVSLQVLHQVIGTNQDLETIRVTRVKLYDIFIEEWIERNKIRLLDSQHKLPLDEQHALEELTNDHIAFTQHAFDFMKRLSTSIFEWHSGNPSIEYSQHSDSTSWKAPYFSNIPKANILRKVSPLEGGGTQFRLLHRSMLEYFYALTFFDPAETPETDDDNDVPSFEALRDSLKAHPLTMKPIVGEPLVVQFLAERARAEPRFQLQLLVMMDTMEGDVKSVQGAKNAVAILVEAGIRFNGVDLSTVRPQWYSST